MSNPYGYPPGFQPSPGSYGQHPGQQQGYGQPGYGPQPSQYPMAPQGAQGPMPAGYGEMGGAPGDPSYRQALLQMPAIGQMGGNGPVPFVRYPFYPTAPYYSTNEFVGTQTRFYSCGMVYTEADYRVGAEAPRPVQFDIPCRIIGFTGSALYYFGTPAVVSSLPLGVDARDTFRFRVEYTTGDKLHINARLGSTVVGTMQNPGEIGGVGYTVDQGASLGVYLTPMLANLLIDITIIALEMRGPRNFSR
jgi:hypothetical protein